MARDAVAVASFAGSVIRPVVLVDLEWDALEHVRVHNRIGDITVNGEIFKGIGGLGSISGINEGEGQAVRNVTLTLVGVQADAYEIISTAQITNRTGRIFLGNMSEDGKTLAGSPIMPFEGVMRALSYKVRRLDEDSQTNVIELRLQSHHAHIRRTKLAVHDHPYLSGLIRQEQNPPVWPA